VMKVFMACSTRFSPKGLLSRGVTMRRAQRAEVLQLKYFTGNLCAGSQALRSMERWTPRPPPRLSAPHGPLATCSCAAGALPGASVACSGTTAR
jgi:hypothetical protein